LGVVPDFQLGVCGNGVGVIGTGTTAQCSNSASTGGDPGGNPGGGNPGGNPGSNPGSGSTVNVDTAGSGTSFVDALVAAPGAALGELLGRGTLPFTGGNTLLTAFAGVALAGIGAAMLRLRRFGLIR
jgi:hypothetical protein